MRAWTSPCTTCRPVRSLAPRPSPTAASGRNPPRPVVCRPKKDRWNDLAVPQRSGTAKEPAQIRQATRPRTSFPVWQSPCVSAFVSNPVTRAIEERHFCPPRILLWLTNYEYLIGFHVLQNLLRTATPQRFNLLRQRGPAKAKMNAHVGTAGITDARADGIVLDAVFRDHTNARSNPITIALRSDCPNEQPVIGRRAGVVQDAQRPIEFRENRINPANVVQITEGRASVYASPRKRTACRG